MILAGHETTATALFWSLYLLALDPATQEQLAAEVKAATVDGALDIERDYQRELGRSNDYREGVSAFIEKRAAHFTGQ